MLSLAVTATAQVDYPYPVQQIKLSIESQDVKMAYMDIPPSAAAKGKTIILFHGKNFNGFYWKDLVPFFTAKGYRVIVPDQVGWGRSDHPNIHYSFHLLALNSKVLLDSLGIHSLVVLGHSMGGMLATRFSLMFPQMVEKLILEDPIGLEDYKTFVPYQALDKLFQKEKAATEASYKKYQQSYYPAWKPEYEQYVQAQAADLRSPDFEKIAWSNAVTYQMIYEQPVCYEFSKLAVQTLLVVGEADRTVVGKDLLNDTDKKSHGQYPQLARQFQQMVINSRLVVLPGVGHIPHVQDLPAFKKSIEQFLNK